jgi:hypothetical protein
LTFLFHSQLDIMKMGKFVKTYDISMLSKEYEYIYEAKYFVFEHYVILTNFGMERKAFFYDNHFWIEGEFSFHCCFPF